MGEIAAAIAESIRNRATSVTLVTYTFFWSAWHWEGLYATLFTGQDLIYKKFGLLKNEYVEKYFFGWHGWQSFWGLLVPAVETFIFIWALHRWVLVPMYGIEQDNRTRRRLIKLAENKKVQDAKAQLAKEETKKTVAETKKVVAKTALQRKKNAAEKVDPKIVWEDEFTKFKTHPDYKLFGQVLKGVYEYNGRTYVSGQYHPVFELGPRSLMMADTRGLVKILDQGNRIELTEKGKYFASFYELSF